MAHSLDGARFKLLRAREHYDDVRRRINAFFDRDPDEIVMEADPHRPGEYVLKVRVREEPDPTWGLIIGDVLTNARATLDYLTAELVLLAGGTVTRLTQFPIYDTPSEYQGKGVPRVKGMNPKHAALIETFQPYNGPKRPVNEHPLALLRDLSNLDKHRVLTTLVAVHHAVIPKVIQGIGQVDVLSYTPGPAVDDAEVARVRIVSESQITDMQVNIEVRGRVLINERWPTRPTMMSILGYIESDVLARLERVF